MYDVERVLSIFNIQKIQRITEQMYEKYDTTHSHTLSHALLHALAHALTTHFHISLLTFYILRHYLKNPVTGVLNHITDPTTIETITEKQVDVDAFLESLDKQNEVVSIPCMLTLMVGRSPRGEVRKKSAFKITWWPLSPKENFGKLIFKFKYERSEAGLVI